MYSYKLEIFETKLQVIVQYGTNLLMKQMQYVQTWLVRGRTQSKHSEHVGTLGRGGEPWGKPPRLTIPAINIPDISELGAGGFMWDHQAEIVLLNMYDAELKYVANFFYGNLYNQYTSLLALQFTTKKQIQIGFTKDIKKL